MQLKAYFSNIHQVIIDHLGDAQSEIIAAIAWFTDRDIFEVLCERARSKIKISIILIDDEINKGRSALNFKKFSNLGGKVVFLPAGNGNIMHHKFCVIDRSIVITGSYNWSQKARGNDENITVVTDSFDFASTYHAAFNNILERAGHQVSIGIDAEAVRRRLEMVRNLILLGEQEDIASHLSKLRPAAEAFNLIQIIKSLDEKDYQITLGYIEAYLHKATALVVQGDADITRLRFQLQTLEVRLESLSDEKVDLERQLIKFNKRHGDALGDLIRCILKARANLLRLLVSSKKISKQRTDAEASAREAENAYQSYIHQHGQLQQLQPLPNLDSDSEKELKYLYRKACSLCHPDKVAKESKDAAHRVFVELQSAYKRSDLSGLRIIFEKINTRDAPKTHSTALNEVEELKAAVAELEYAIARLVADLKALQQSGGVQLMNSAGTSEEDWEIYFERQREVIKKELERIESEILITQMMGAETNE